MTRLEGKVAIVTGAASKQGIGRAIAIRLAKEGADIVVSDLPRSRTRYTEDDRIEHWAGIRSVEAEVKALGRRGLAIEADVTSSEQVEEMLARCIAEFGRIDVLVNNAGILGPTNVSTIEVSEEDWQRVLTVNATGPYLCAKTVAKRMIEQGQGGKIINISSISGKTFWKGDFGPYAVSKCAVVGLTKVLAWELAPHKINVNAVCPGFIATEIGMGANIRSDVRRGISLEEATAKAYASVLPQVPLGRVGQPEDIAGMVAFLASNDSDYMTGQAINVSGGFIMH